MDTARTASNDTIFGTEGDDRLKGKQGDDIIYGQGGDDWINGNRDDDTLFGGDGDDTLVGYSGDDVLIGGEGGPSTTGHDMLLGHSGDDILQMASTDGDGMANGGVGNDEYHLTAMTGLGQYHTFEVSGSDTFNLKFDSITDFSHGHHIRGDKNGETSADIFDFQDTSQVSDVVVGRLEDFDPSRDEIAIEGNTLDLGNLPDGVRIVDFDVDPTDTAVGKQQWLLIETEAGGHIFYALEGARVTIEGDGAANGGQHESHFLLEENLPNFDQLNDVPYVDPKNFVPEGYAVSGVITNDVDEKTEDIRLPINVENGDATETADLIAGGINGDIINAAGGDDRIWGGSEADTIFGGDGRDTIFGGDGDDFLNPGAGLESDLGAADSLHGGDGSDTFFIDAADSNVNAIVFDSGDTGQDGLEIDGIDINEMSIDLVDIEEEQALQLAWEDGQVLLAETGSVVESIKVGDDVFEGDVLVGGDQEPLVGNRDANILVGDGETSTLKAGNGDDLIASTAPSSNISGGGGADTVLARHGDDAIWTHGGDDVVVLQGGENTVYAGAGDDTVFLNGGRSVVSGDSGSDVFVVRNTQGASDKIHGFDAGSDVVDLTNYAGLEYQDLVLNHEDGSGNLTIALGNDPESYILEIDFAGEQAGEASIEEMLIISDEEAPEDQEDSEIDTISATSSTHDETGLEMERQVLFAEAGLVAESIINGEEVFDGDVLLGADHEPLVGDRDANALIGDGESSTLKAANGDDLIVSAAASSNISGGGGGDIVLSGHGDDEIWAHGGDDLVVLQGGENTVFAGAGDDTLFLDGGRSVVSGDSGADVFVVRNAQGASDKIHGFETGSDAIDLTNYAGLEYQDLVLNQEDAGHLTIALGNDPDSYILEIDFAGEQTDEASIEEMFIFSDEEARQDLAEWDISTILKGGSAPAENGLEMETQDDNDIDLLDSLA